MPNELGLTERKSILGIRAVEGAGVTEYRLLPQHPAFLLLNMILMSVSAMSMAISKLRSQDISDGDYLGIGCKAFDFVVRFPAGGPVRVALANEYPEFIDIAVVAGRQNTTSHWASPLRSWLQHLMWPSFVILYEQLNRWGSNVEDMPDVWKVAWVLRNAYAHGLKICWSRTKPPLQATWLGFDVNKSDSGRAISDFVADAALLVMILALSDAAIPS